MSIFYHIKSISEAHKFLGIKPPAHPLITIIREWPVVDFDFANTKMTSDLFIVGMKGGAGAIRYGRSTYDYESGTMVFTAPKQALTFDSNVDYTSHKGWTILFHPDLIRKSVLGSEITKKTANAFDGIANAVNNMLLNNQQISQTAQQQAIAIQQVVDAMNMINLSAGETASGISQTKIGTQQLNQAAQKLNLII